MKCPRCGKEFESRFCPDCGFCTDDIQAEDLKNISDSQDPKAENSNGKETDHSRESAVETDSQTDHAESDLPGSPEPAPEDKEPDKKIQGLTPSVVKQLSENTGNEKTAGKTGKPRKKRKLLRIILIVVCVIIGLFILSGVIGTHAEKKEKQDYLKNAYHQAEASLEYEGLTIHYPSDAESEEYKNEEEYTLTNSSGYDVITVKFSHLTGVAGEKFNDIYEDKIRKDVSEDITDQDISGSNYKGKYISYVYTGDDDDGFAYTDNLIKVDNSYFVMNTKVNRDYRYDGLLNDIYDSIDFKDYSTPQITRLSAKYTGDAMPGTTPDQILSDTSVKLTFKNGDTEDISDDCQIEGKDLDVNTTRKYKITYTDEDYDGKDYSTEITVRCAVYNLQSLTAKYTGSTKKGTEINSSASGLKVTAVMQNGKKLKLHKGDFKVENPSELEAGKTNTYTISYGNMKTTLSITCTSLSEAQKDQQFKNSCSSYSFSELAHYPDKYEGKRIKVSGEVLQVMDGSYRVAMGGDYDCVVYVDDWRSIYDPDNTSEKQIIEDDYITIYGECDGTQSYTTVMGAELTIPKIVAHFIDN